MGNDDAVAGMMVGRVPRLGISALPGVLLCALLFDADFLLGRGAYWDDPHGIMGGGRFDMSIAMSAYFHFLHDGWGWQLFHAAGFGAPDGTNILLADGLPLLALVGRVVHRLSGQAVNLFGLWAALCIVLNGVGLGLLVAAFGLRSRLGVLAAAVIGVSMPMFLARFGHLALSGHFVIPWALAMHVRLLGAAPPKWQGGAWQGWAWQAGGLAVLSLLINPYLCVMVLGVLLAALAQLAWDGAGRRDVARMALMVIAPVALAAWVGGFLATGFRPSRDGYGVFGFNLASPFFPQMSGVLPGGVPGPIDATGGQHEGFAYLGAGVLALLIVGFAPGWRAVVWRRYAGLGVLGAGFLAFAISHEVYVFNVHLLAIPLPGIMLELADMFRAGGRFVWPIVYAVAGGVIAAVGLRFGRWGAVILLAAAGLQWVDAGPLRAAIAASLHAPPALAVAAEPWRAVLARHGSVEVMPSPFCLADEADKLWALRVKVAVQLFSGQTGTPILRPQLARTRVVCADEWARGVDFSGQGRALRIYVPGWADFAAWSTAARGQENCLVWPELIVCGAREGGVSEALRPQP